jgi:hypothetical protein
MCIVFVNLSSLTLSGSGASVQFNDYGFFILSGFVFESRRDLMCVAVINSNFSTL